MSTTHKHWSERELAEKTTRGVGCSPRGAGRPGISGPFPTAPRFEALAELQVAVPQCIQRAAEEIGIEGVKAFFNDGHWEIEELFTGEQP